MSGDARSEMQHEQNAQQEPVHVSPSRREWSAPRLERLDFDGTEKGSSSIEDTLAYASPPIC
jgi:hypothetical protein